MQFNLLKNKEKSQNQNTNFNKKTQEKSYGRSMVEMLGVLAIIGVLSIGGIQGYTIAMRKYRANEIISVMGKYAAVLYSHCMTEQLDEEKINEVYSFRGDLDVVEAYDCKMLKFSEAGLGAVPSGVEKYWSSWPSDIIRTQSGDMVRVYVNLTSKELCQEVVHTFGIEPVIVGGDGAAVGYCDPKGSAPLTALGYFIMN